MKQHQAVIEVMRANGGFATLGLLYQEALKVPGVKWGTNTPFASIRRIVQNPTYFFKIKPGLWALNEAKNRLPFGPTAESKETTEEFNHSYYQGLLVEIGNMTDHGTFVPSQDRNKMFLNRPLSSLTTVGEYFPFSYEAFVRKAKTVDVSWFNSRKMPARLFEVEHTTDINNSLLKFTELQDFNVRFFIVANAARSQEFATKLGQAAFKVVQEKVKFLNYEALSNLHGRVSIDRANSWVL